MSACSQCGQEIQFRNIGGRVIPMGCACKSTSGTEPREEENFCRRTTCPRCGGGVFFLRHNGGSVWLDDLGYPWPVHRCFAADEPKVAAFRRLGEGFPNRERVRLGMVVGIRRFAADHHAYVRIEQDEPSDDWWQVPLAEARLIERGELAMLAPPTLQCGSMKTDRVTGPHVYCRQCGKFSKKGSLHIHRFYGSPDPQSLRLPCPICGVELLEREMDSHLAAHRHGTQGP